MIVIYNYQYMYELALVASAGYLYARCVITFCKHIRMKLQQLHLNITHIKSE